MLNKTQFIEQALLFKEELNIPRSLDDLHHFWRSTAFPYQLDSVDPFSRNYRDEVLEIYQCLAGVSYKVSNELTSTLQTEADFRVGYPWVSKNLRVVASELGKAVQAIKIISEHSPGADSFIEYGSGWGNLVIPLARSGMNVTAIDIDQGFINRTKEEAELLNLKIDLVKSDFIEGTFKRSNCRYDVVIFSSSFHHCLEFIDLLKSIRDSILKPQGKIYFFAEPVSESLSFPWGLRYDGESIWAITCNKWFELGFSEEFFRDLFPKLGFSISEIADTSGLCGRAWVASKA
jgi:2-polyprenyl-3-methyl-5-hydroxy-6-metoxy-1,4-benzoquinol methylase